MSKPEFVCYQYDEENGCRVRCHDGQYRLWKDTNGIGSGTKDVSLHTNVGAKRIMNSNMDKGATVAGSIRNECFINDNSFVVRAIKNNCDPH